MKSPEERSVVVLATPVAVGHVRVLMPLARRLVTRGFEVIWAISGDANEPAARWRQPLSDLGARFIDVDEVARFDRNLDESAGPGVLALLRRIAGRANDVAPAGAEAIRAAAGGRPIVAGVYDYFALWAYVAMRRLGIERIQVAVSSFPAAIVTLSGVHLDDPIVTTELARLRDSGFGRFDRALRGGVIPDDPTIDVLSFTSPRLCQDAPDYVRVLGVQCEALPRVEDLGSLPEEQQALVRRLREAREASARVVLLSMGTVVMRMMKRLGPAHTQRLRELYGALAAAALRSGAIVVASTTDSTPSELGVDEAALGPAARDRVIAMPFVPQPLLFAQGLVDVMLTHGGANTFHEAVLAGIPLLVCPAFGDQERVACAAAKLGIAECIETPVYPSLEGALPLRRVAEETLPEMLAPGTSRWKAAVTRLAAQLKDEDGLGAAEAIVLGTA